MTDRSLVDWYVRICEDRSHEKGERRRLWFAIAAEIERAQAELGNRDVTPEEIDAVCARIGVPPLSRLVACVRASPSGRAKAPRETGGEPWPEDPLEVVTKNWTEVEKIVGQLCGKFGADEEMATTVTLKVQEKLFANDFRVVLNFRQQSSFRSYLTTIVERTFLDVQTERSGKWHYSAAAERLGPLAKALEHMVHLERYEASEAIEVLLGWHPETTRAELEAIWQQIPARLPRPAKVDFDASVQSVRGSDPDVLDLSGDRFRLSSAATAVVQRFIDGLAVNDRLLLQWLFEEDLKVATIATILKVPQKNLYRRRNQLLNKLRRHLEKAGITRSEAADLYDFIGRYSIFRFVKKEQ